MPCGFAARDMRRRTSGSSSFGTCRMEAQAQIPSYRFWTARSWKRRHCTGMPVFRLAMSAIFGEPSVASTLKPRERKYRVSRPEPQPKSRILPPSGTRERNRSCTEENGMSRVLSAKSSACAL